MEDLRLSTESPTQPQYNYFSFLGILFLSCSDIMIWTFQCFQEPRTYHLCFTAAHGPYGNIRHCMVPCMKIPQNKRNVLIPERNVQTAIPYSTNLFFPQKICKKQYMSHLLKVPCFHCKFLVRLWNWCFSSTIPIFSESPKFLDVGRRVCSYNVLTELCAGQRDVPMWKRAAEQGCGTCQPRDRQCRWESRAGRGQNNMGWVTNVLVILAHGKMGLLGNNRNNVTRQDEPSACLWVVGTAFGVGFRGEKKESRLFAGGRAGWLRQRDLSPTSWHLQSSSWLGTPSVQTWLACSLCWSALHWILSSPRSGLLIAFYYYTSNIIPLFKKKKRKKLRREPERKNSL